MSSNSDQKIPSRLINKCLLIMALAISSATNANNAAQTDEADSSDKDIQGEVVKVIGSRNRAITEVDEDTKKLLKVPGIDGDPLSAVYSLPGVVIAGGDYGGEPAIRGSSPDDNAYYIDFMPAGYVFHAFGTSIFNENLVQKFDLYPAGFGAQFGEATGGIVDVSLRDPRNQELAGTFDWSLLKTGILVESGLGDNQAFYASYRKSLLHLYIKEDEEDEEGITFFEAPQSDDYQFKYQWLIGDNQKFTLTAAGAGDYTRGNISEASEEGRADPEIAGDLYYDDSFDSVGARWELFSENGGYWSLGVSKLDNTNLLTFGDGQFIDQQYKETFFRGYYQKNWFKDHKLTLGMEVREFDFTYAFDVIPYFCTDHQQDCEAQRGDRIQDSTSLLQKTNAAYISNQWKVTNSIALDVGLRGEYNDYTEEKFVMPRFAIEWYLDSQFSLNAKAGQYTRFPDAETAVRILGNPDIKSPRADHFSVGAKYRFQSVWQAGIDVYRKNMSELPLALAEDDPDYDIHYTNEMSGNAHGVEFLVERDLADGWYGWASLSWSKSERTNDRTGVTEDYYLDTPLILNIVGNYELNERWNFGARLTVRSGQKYTPIVGLRPNEFHDGHYLPVYGELNSKTLPTYHRLDLQAEYQYQVFGLDAAWTFALINALGHENVEGYHFAPDGNETLEDFVIAEERGIEQFPSVGFKLHF